MYFDAKEYLEKDINFYLFIGNKSIGKTYWGIHYIINKWLQDREGFAWVFNTQDEVKDFKSELLNYLNNYKMPIYDLKNNKKIKIETNRFKIIGFNVWDLETNEIWGKLGSINTHHKLKNLQNCKTLIFDEVDNGNGQLNRADRFGKFTKIISNMERKKKNFMVFCFMNAESKDNIIFDGLSIKYKGEPKILCLGGKGLIITLPKYKYFNQTERDDSLAYHIMQNDEKTYKMAFENTFAKDDDRLITTTNNIRPKSYLYDIVYLKYRLTAFLDYNNNMIIDREHFSGQETKMPVITLSPADTIWEQQLPKSLKELAEKISFRVRKGTIQFTTYWIKDIILAWLVQVGKGATNE